MAPAEDPVHAQLAGHQFAARSAWRSAPPLERDGAPLLEVEVAQSEAEAAPANLRGTEA